MSRVTVLAAASAAMLMSTAAPAADLPLIPPPPPPVEFASAWYLRGDIGLSQQSVRRLYNVLYDTTIVQPVGIGFDSAGFFGVGLGYAFNEWFRFDLTVEYRGKANFHGIDIVGGGVLTDEYTASKSEWLLLANAYVDLGTWWSITPFIGAGIGTSRNTISSFLDVCSTVSGCPGGSVAFGPTASKWDFAWALYAGLAYKATPGLTLELAYRYVSLGDATTGDLITFNGISTIYNPMEFIGITSHDLKFGVRWSFGGYTEPAPLYTPPLMRKG